MVKPQPEYYSSKADVSVDRTQAAKVMSVEANKKEAAKLFPYEEWKAAEKIVLAHAVLPEGLKGIKVAASKLPVNKQEEHDLVKELKSAKVLEDFGMSAWLIPMAKDSTGKHIKGPDALVGGKLFEFKEVIGGIRNFEKRFRDSRKQGENVYIRITDTSITKDDVTRKLYGIINDKNYTGGFNGELAFTLYGSKKPYFIKLKDLKD